MNHAEELTQLFFRTKKINNPGRTYVNSMQRLIIDLLQEGIDYSAIERAIKEHPEDFRTYARKFKSEEVGSILRKDRFYYHPELQISPPPPVYVLNNDGSIVKKEQDFFLRIKAKYTYEDLLNYFYLRFPYLDRNLKRDLAGMEYLCKKVAVPIIEKLPDKDLNAIDLLLFSIDSAYYLCEDKDDRINKLLNISDFINSGLETYLDKRENCILSGINHVI